MKEGWTYKKFTDVVWFQEGPGVRKTQYTDSGVKLLNVANLVDGKIDLTTSKRYISEEEAYGKYNHFLVDDGDFIIASSGIQVDYFEKKMGFITASQLPLCMNTSTIRFKALDKSALNMKFLMYYLKSNHFKNQLSRQITGIAQLNFGPLHLKRMFVPITDFKEQSHIVSELDLLSSIIEKKKAQLKEYDQLSQSIFYDMFGDPVTNEKGWEVKKIGEIASVKTGPFGSMLHKEDYISDGIPLVNPIHIRDFHIVADMDFTITNEKAEELSNYILQKDDVVFARRGDIGRCAVVSDKENGYLCGTGSLFVRFVVEIVSTYIMYVIRSSSFTKELISNAKGATMLNLNSSIIENSRLPLPPLHLQQQFDEKIEAIEKQKELIKQSIAESQTLLDYTMDKYFG